MELNIFFQISETIHLRKSISNIDEKTRIEEENTDDESDDDDDNNNNETTNDSINDHSIKTIDEIIKNQNLFVSIEEIDHEEKSSSDDQREEITIDKNFVRSKVKQKLKKKLKQEHHRLCSKGESSLFTQQKRDQKETIQLYLQ